MRVDCPECSVSLDGDPGAEIVCPACMTPFLLPSEARAVPAFDVQPGGDAVLFGVSRHAIREAIYTGRFTASARVRHDGGRWELIGGLPEFAAVFRLLGGDLAPMAGTRKLAGWRRAAELDAPVQASLPPRPTPKPSARPSSVVETRLRRGAEEGSGLGPIPGDDGPPTWAAPFAPPSSPISSPISSPVPAHPSSLPLPQPPAAAAPPWRTQVARPSTRGSAPVRPPAVARRWLVAAAALVVIGFAVLGLAFSR